MTWISVEDRLPDDDISVLVYVPDAPEPIWLGFYDMDEWTWVDGGTNCRPTHWMELPEPPETHHESPNH